MGELRFGKKQRHFADIVRIPSTSNLPAVGKEHSSVRPDGRNKLEYLHYDNRVKLCDWLLNTPQTYTQIVARVKKEFGVTTDPAKISIFYRKYCYQELVRRREQSVREVGNYNKDVEKNPMEAIEATMDALWAKAWTEVQKPEVACKDLKIYIELLVRLKGQVIDEKKLGLMERRLMLVEQKTKSVEDTIKKSRLSDDQFIERMRTILNRDTDHSTLSSKHTEKATSSTNGFSA